MGKGDDCLVVQTTGEGDMIVAIMATGRNGSTLLMNLLDGSPDLWVHPVEFNYLSAFSDLARFSKLKRATAQNANTESPLDLDAEVDAKLLLKTFSRQIDEVENIRANVMGEKVELKSNPFNDMHEKQRYGAPEFFWKLLRSVRNSYDVRNVRPIKYFVIKSLEVPFIDDYVKTFPNIRFIHLMRNPLMNYESLKRSNMMTKRWPFWEHGGDQLRMFLEKRWIPHASFVANLKEEDRERHLWLTYEELCESPSCVVSRICEWLGVAVPVEQGKQTLLGGRAVANLPPSSSKKGVKTPVYVTKNMASEHQYEHILSSREEQFIIFRTLDLAKRLGYFHEHLIRPNPLDLMGKWILPDEWELKNSRNFFKFGWALLMRRLYIASKLLF